MRDTMLAAVFKGEGVLALEEVARPVIEHTDDVLVRVEACSICGSDLHILNVPPGQSGKPGVTMGHEFVGRVEQVGPGVTAFRPGDRVVMEPNLRCGTCPECRGGVESLCRNAVNTGQWRNGGFAAYCIAPEKQLYAIPEDIPAKYAALAEPLACVMHGMMAVNPMPQHRAVVFGAGATGLLFVGALRAFGLREVAMVAPREESRQKALACGASLALDPSQGELPAQLEKHWGGGADLVIESSGSGAAFEQGVNAAAGGGRMLVFGQNLRESATFKPGRITEKQLTITATLSTQNSFPAAIELLRRGGLPLGEIVTHEIPLEEIGEGIALMQGKKAVKVVVYPGRGE